MVEHNKNDIDMLDENRLLREDLEGHQAGALLAPESGPPVPSGSDGAGVEKEPAEKNKNRK